MHNKRLQEIAKFGSGVIAADFITHVWLANAGLLPVEFLGMVFTQDILVASLVFDAALFFILVHYGWNIGKIPALRERTYLLIAGVVFGLVALAHLYHVFTQADFSLAGMMMPLWLSWLGVGITTYLCYMSFRLALRMKK